MKADLHIHTKYSMDCSTPLDKIVNRCLELGINCIAIADHNTTEGALEMQSLAPFPVIVAEEIMTTQGEIMGMFLKESVPRGLSLGETVSRIKAQEALVCIPHPFDTLLRHGLGGKKIEEIIDQIDVLEVFNSRTLFCHHLNQARAFAQKHGIPGSAGSDAHTVYEIGNAYVEMPGFEGGDDFLNALVRGKVYGHRTNPLIHFSNARTRLKAILAGDK